MSKFLRFFTIFLSVTFSVLAFASKAKWVLSEDWAKTISCEDYLSDSADLVQLKHDLLEFRPTLLKQMTENAATSRLLNSRFPLCDSVCGLVTDKLKSFLTERGYKFTQVITRKLGTHDYRYISPDHTFVVVHLENRDVIVDGAYLSFFAQAGSDFKVDVARVVFGDILILPYEHLDAWVNEISNLREQYYEFYEKRKAGALQERKGSGSDSSLYFELSSEEFAKYMKRIWNFNDPIYTVK